MLGFSLRCAMVAFLGVLGFSACSGDPEPVQVALAQGCTINSDCVAPLVCAFKRCHDECNESRDCPNDQHWMVSDRPFHVCQLPVEETCSYNRRWNHMGKAYYFAQVQIPLERALVQPMAPVSVQTIG
jgi:hypothetical protein